MEKLNTFLVKYYNNKGLGLSALIGFIVGAVVMVFVGKKKTTAKRR